jgi:hypothetical protein
MPTVEALTEKIQEGERQFQELNAQINAGEEQLAALKDNRQQIIGRVVALQELVQEETGEFAPVVPEAPVAGPDDVVDGKGSEVVDSKEDVNQAVADSEPELTKVK